MKKIFMSIFFILIFIDVSFSQVVEYRGKGSVEYRGGFSGKPKVEEMRDAKEKAIKAAWNNFIANLDISGQSNYADNEKNINYQDYILETYVINEDVNKQLKEYSITVRVKIDKTAFEAKVSSFSKASSKESDEKSYVLAIFIGRQAVSQTNFKDTHTSAVSYNSTSEIASGMLGGGGDTMQIRTQNAQIKANAEISTGGSVEHKKAELKYTILPATDFSAAFNKVLSENGYEPIQYSDVLECGVPNMRDIQDQFALNDELSPELESILNKAVKNCDISYLIVGYVQMGMPEQDSSTGLKGITSTASGKVLDLRTRFAKNIASVSESYRGRGSNDTEATFNSQKSVAEATAKSIVDQLHSKGAY